MGPFDWVGWHPTQSDRPPARQKWQIRAIAYSDGVSRPVNPSLSERYGRTGDVRKFALETETRTREYRYWPFSASSAREDLVMRLRSAWLLLFVGLGLGAAPVTVGEKVPTVTFREGTAAP